jgi:hypothetical protein
VRVLDFWGLVHKDQFSLEDNSDSRESVVLEVRCE